MSYTVDDEFRAEALGHLRRLTEDPTSDFRDQQLEVIHRLVEQRQRVLLVQRTGWGKSAVYFIATRMLRDRGGGPTLLVSPLLALMRNQIEAAERMGVQAVTVNSTNRNDWDEVFASVASGSVDLLLISPERLANQDFRRDVLPEVGRRSGLLVVDEVHCVSDWGHDFRPDYRRIRRVLDLLPAGVPIIGCTATANNRVIEDVDEQLATDATVRGPLGREGLRQHVIDMAHPAERLVWLSETIPGLGGSGIVYTLTVADTNRAAEWLKSQGIDAVAYHGALDTEKRLIVEQRLLANEVDVVVSTSALGMGFDKPDLGFVIHYQAPSSAITYYQQVGRAGRQLSQSWGVLLRGAEDEDIQDYFIENAFPPEDLAEEVVACLETSGESFTLTELEQFFNVRRMRLAHLLKVLEVEGAVERDGYRWRRTLTPWSFDSERVKAVTALRRVEQGEMVGYAENPTCRMAYLRNLLDDPTDDPCGICDRCAGESLEIELDPRLVAQAVEHIRRGYLTIDSRKKWPDGGWIPAEHRSEIGRALSRWGDGGWGDRVAENRKAGLFDDELLDAAVELISQRWQPDPAPTWVTVVPSTRFPGVTAEFAARLAERLGLGFVEAIERVADREPQRTMNNSVMQFQNVDGVFAASGTIDPGPVLLVDDVVDSRWTMTLVGAALRHGGSGPVHPFALADAAGRST
ncbi:MAG: ATP-dependent DNA helicase RecQ [Acidimicrobiia bacterium]|nr:ATP-dependent DNA helicase RecQ [Acidimicrobiia bacterium]